jgi:hypothetical protein
MTNHNEAAKVNDKACPRCGCFMVKHFDCNCGEVHGDYCLNCGRWASLKPNEHVKLSEFDTRCEKGAVEHTHEE